jgi:hypothetical protein
LYFNGWSNNNTFAKDADFEGTHPDLSTLSSLIYKHYNELTSLDEDDESYIKSVFIVTQLMEIALLMDFGDELGKRNLFASMSNINTFFHSTIYPYLVLLEDILVYKDPPEAHIGRVVDIIKKISINESDFTRYILFYAYNTFKTLTFFAESL